MFFYKFAAVAAVGGGGSKLILRIAYVVRSLYFNFQPNRTIFTMFSPRTAKTTHLSSPPLVLSFSLFQSFKDLMFVGGGEFEEMHGTLAKKFGIGPSFVSDLLTF